MNNEVNKKLESLLSHADAEKIKSFAASEEGQKLKRQIGGADRNKIVEEFLKMDSEQLKKKLENANLSGLSGLSAEQILKKLR